MTRITGSLHEDQRTFFIISPLVLLTMRDISEKVIEKIKTFYGYMCVYIYIYILENRAVMR